MKKILALVLALLMVLAMAACGSTAAPAENPEAAADESSASAAEATAAEEPAPAEEPAEASDEASAEASAEPSGEAPEAAEGIDDLAYVQEKGVLVIGITDFEPMDYMEDGEWVGFDADLGRKFAESLGVDVEFIEIDWDNKILELNSQAIDCIWNGMTLTPEVMAAASCSNAYMLNAQVVVLPADAADEYPDIESMADLTFAVEAGSAGEGVVEELGYSATPVQTQSNALMEVAAGTSDAAVIDLLMAYAMVGEGTGYENLTYTINLNEEEYGVAFRTGSDLVDALNDFFAEAYADGTMDELAETYGLAGSVIPQ